MDMYIAANPRSRWNLHNLLLSSSETTYRWREDTEGNKK